MAPHDDDERSTEISEKTPISLQLGILAAAGMLAMAGQWFDMRLQIAQLDAKQTAAVVALEAKQSAAMAALEAKFEAKITEAKAASSGDHHLLCAIAAKLNVIGGDCR